jgi:hypothetical protein
MWKPNSHFSINDIHLLNEYKSENPPHSKQQQQKMT